MNSPYKAQIEDLIRNSDFGITSSQIASQLSLAWRTVDKYLKELVREGLVIPHAVGPYSVFTTRKHAEQSIFQYLYYGALKVGAFISQGGVARTQKVPDAMREIWKELGGRLTLPFETEMVVIKDEPSPEELERLIGIVKNILCNFGYFGDYPKVEAVPPLGTTLPMTRLIRLHDPGFIKAGAWTHYYLLASLIEEKLTQKTGTHVAFHVAREIQPQDEMVYFEIGFVDFYYLDLSIYKKSDPAKDARHYLDLIKNFFSKFLYVEVHEYEEELPEKGEKMLHYRVKILDNQQVDEFFTFRARSLRENAKIFDELKIKSNRQWLPMWEWPEDPFLVVDFVTNMGFVFQDYHEAMRETFPKPGYLIHVEKIPTGVRINFKEPFDFDILFLNQIDDAAVREHYKALGITSEEFFARRKQSIGGIFAELQQQRLFKRKEKGKKKS